MTHFTDMTGLFGSAVAIVALSARLLGAFRIRRMAWLLTAIFLATLIPVGGMPLAGYLRGAVGDLSITSMLLLFLGLLPGMRDWTIPPERNSVLLLSAGTAVFFYPLALGWGGFDPYRLGYGNYGFLAGLLGVALVAAWRGLPTLAVAIAMAVSAWSAGWYESTNLWDYLLDPLVSVYALAAVFAQGMRRLKAARARPLTAGVTSRRD
jgi:hypothetical protein